MSAANVERCNAWTTTKGSRSEPESGAAGRAFGVFGSPFMTSWNNSPPLRLERSFGSETPPSALERPKLQRHGLKRR